MKYMPIKPLIALSVIMLPQIVLAQLQTPAEAAEVALRARVTQFLQYHVEGNFRKAYDMIADDTKDDYFNSGKTQIKGFTIDKIAFTTEDFTKASVSATISKTMAIVGQEIPITVPSNTTWKIENGKWVWYNDVQSVGVTPLNPMGVSPSSTAPQSAVTQGAVTQNNDTGLPKNFDDKSLAAAAQSILRQVGVDRTEATLATNKPSEDKIIFHNGMPGSVQLELNAPEAPGFTAKLDQSNVKAGGDVPVVFRYEPADPAGRRDPLTVQLVVQPLNQIFMIRVNFSATGPVTSK